MQCCVLLRNAIQCLTMLWIFKSEMTAKVLTMTAAGYTLLLTLGSNSLDRYDVFL